MYQRKLRTPTQGIYLGPHLPNQVDGFDCGNPVLSVQPSRSKNILHFLQTTSFHLFFLILALHIFISPLFSQKGRNFSACRSAEVVFSYCDSATPGFSPYSFFLHRHLVYAAPALSISARRARLSSLANRALGLEVGPGVTFQHRHVQLSVT